MSETTSDAQPFADHTARLWATLMHLGGILFYFLPSLVAYALLADRGPFIRQQARSALNFQLTLLVGYVVGFFTAWLIVGIFVVLAVAVVNIIFSILAALEADKGARWNFPLAIPFLRA